MNAWHCLPLTLKTIVNWARPDQFHGNWARPDQCHGNIESRYHKSPAGVKFMVMLGTFTMPPPSHAFVRRFTIAHQQLTTQLLWQCQPQTQLPIRGTSEETAEVPEEIVTIRDSEHLQVNIFMGGRWQHPPPEGRQIVDEPRKKRLHGNSVGRMLDCPPSHFKTWVIFCHCLSKQTWNTVGPFYLEGNRNKLSRIHRPIGFHLQKPIRPMR